MEVDQEIDQWRRLYDDLPLTPEEQWAHEYVWAVAARPLADRVEAFGNLRRAALLRLTGRDDLDEEDPDW